jgi:hypothetical protein
MGKLALADPFPQCFGHCLDASPKSRKLSTFIVLQAVIYRREKGFGVDLLLHLSTLGTLAVCGVEAPSAKVVSDVALTLEQIVEVIIGRNVALIAVANEEESSEVSGADFEVNAVGLKSHAESGRLFGAHPEMDLIVGALVLVIARGFGGNVGFETTGGTGLPKARRQPIL